MTLSYIKRSKKKQPLRGGQISPIKKIIIKTHNTCTGCQHNTGNDDIENVILQGHNQTSKTIIAPWATHCLQHGCFSSQKQKTDGHIRHSARGPGGSSHTQPTQLPPGARERDWTRWGSSCLSLRHCRFCFPGCKAARLELACTYVLCSVHQHSYITP